MIFMSFNNRNDNLGDRLIYNHLRSELEKHTNVLPYKSQPSDSQGSALRFRQIFLKALKKKIFKGENSIIMDSPGARFKPRKLVKLSKISKMKKSLEGIAWRLIGGKYVVTGISVDNTAIIKNYRHYNLIGVRDNFSFDILKDHGLPVQYCPDMSFLQTPKKKSPNNSILLSFRAELPDDNYDHKTKSKLERLVESLIPKFEQRKANIYFYSQVTEDNNFNRKLAEKFGYKYIEQPPNETDLDKVFSQHSIVISNRLHVLLPAAFSGCLPIALTSGNQMKINSLFETVNMNNFLVSIDHPSEIIKKIDNLFTNYSQISEGLHKNSLNQNILCKEFIKQIANT